MPVVLLQLSLSLSSVTSSFQLLRQKSLGVITDSSPLQSHSIMSENSTVSAFKGRGWTRDSPIAAILGGRTCTDWWESGTGATGWWRGSAARQGGTGTYPLGDR